jgi:hypothetical protein
MNEHGKFVTGPTENKAGAKKLIFFTNSSGHPDYNYT